MKSSTARGTVVAPPSKSYTHRAIVLGTLTHHPFVLRQPLHSDDTMATLSAVQLMGAAVTGSPSEMRIACEKLSPALAVIDCRNSGTTMRLVAGIAALLDSTTTLTGDSSLVRRPVGPLVEALEQLGARCSYIGQPGTPPVRISGPMTGASASMPGNVSSQFISSLLIACTQKSDDTVLEVQGDVISRPYVDITLAMLSEFGAVARERDGKFEIPGDQRLKKDSYKVPGDYSSASFMLAAGAITDGDVTVKNLDQKSPQGDRAVLEHLEGFGASVSRNGDSVRVRGGRLRGNNVDVRDTPDLFPVLAVVGAVAEGKTVISGGANLRQKESDRIATTTAFLRAMGARVKPTADGCEILGGEKLHGAAVNTSGDHRILMAAALAALVSTSGTQIEDDESYKVSYPGFLRDMHQLGCRLEVRR